MKKQAISISVKEKDEILEYTVRWKNKPNGEEMSCKSMEYPRPELLEALSGCEEFIPLICGIPKESIRRIIVAGATFKYTKQGSLYGIAFGATLIMNVSRVLDIRTPEMGLRVGSPDLEISTMWEDRLTKQAMVLHDEILLYAEGKRAQTELNFEGEGNNELYQQEEAGEEAEEVG